MHCVGPSTILMLTSDQATAEERVLQGDWIEERALS
jgi:hypothetical protein